MYTENTYKKLYVTIIALGIATLIILVAILGIHTYKWKNYRDYEGIITKTDEGTSVFVPFGLMCGERYHIQDIDNQFVNRQRVTAVMYIGSDEPILWDVRPIEDKLW